MPFDALKPTGESGVFIGVLELDKQVLCNECGRSIASGLSGYKFVSLADAGLVPVGPVCRNCLGRCSPNLRLMLVAAEVGSKLLLEAMGEVEEPVDA